MTSETSTKCTCSPASRDGRTRSTSRDGATDRFGPPPALVSRYRARESDRERMIPVISGPLFTASSPSANLQSSLESKLRARMAGSGSPLYELTWKSWDMPLGPRICALRASAHRIFGSDFSGWPTVLAPNGGRGLGFTELKGRTYYNPRTGRKCQLGLEHAAKLAGTADDGELIELDGWNTVTAKDGRRGNAPPRPHDRGTPLSQQAVLAGWATPTSRDHKDGATDMTNVPTNALLGRQALLSGWGTVRSVESGHSSGSKKRAAKPRARIEDQASGTRSSTYRALTGDGDLSDGSLNPQHCRWLQGYPPEWTRFQDTETRSSLKLRRRS